MNTITAHLEAQPGDIADAVLLPGDPLRARYIAEEFLEHPRCYNRIRGMLGYTGTYKGKTLSVQGTGMGIPSISIYVHELIAAYGAKRLIRIGTCGSIQEEVAVRDVILAMGASTDSAANKLRFGGRDYAALADFELLSTAWERTQFMDSRAHVGNVLTIDSFYTDDEERWKPWAEYGVLAMDMESSALYTLAARHGVQALSILTVSDSVVTGEACDPEERQGAFNDMIDLALEIV